MKKIFLFLTAFFFFGNESFSKQCTGRVVNPISDVCWECILPISIGSMEVVPGETSDTPNYPSPICICPAPPPEYRRVGIAVGFWEPIRLADVTKEPFCFVGIGGKKIDAGITLGSGGDPEVGTGNEIDPATWSVHWYIYPVLNMINSEVDDMCSDSSETYDISYITEVDPLWQDEELAFAIAPESILFGNLIAQAACAADCLASSYMMPLDPLFWCAGCQGSMYPLTGKVIHHNTSIQSSLLVAERMIYKLHRETFLHITSGPDAICSSYPSAMIKKSQYRTQMTIPVRTTDPKYGCNQYGKSTFMWESMREIPVTGEDFNYLIWRKRNCCVSE